MLGWFLGLIGGAVVSLVIVFGFGIDNEGLGMTIGLFCGMIGTALGLMWEASR